MKRFCLNHTTVPQVKKQKQEEKTTDVSLLEGKPPTAAQEHDGKNSWTKRAIREICAFLILSNIMVTSRVFLCFLCRFYIHPSRPCSLSFQLWVIPAFGVHPQFENGLGKQFFGFSAWFVLVNLGQPLSVFYRMHSVGALMELLIAA